MPGDSASHWMIMADGNLCFRCSHCRPSHAGRESRCLKGAGRVSQLRCGLHHRMPIIKEERLRTCAKGMPRCVLIIDDVCIQFKKFVMVHPFPFFQAFDVLVRNSSWAGMIHKLPSSIEWKRRWQMPWKKIGRECPCHVYLSDRLDSTFGAMVQH